VVPLPVGDASPQGGLRIHTPGEKEHAKAVEQAANGIRLEAGVADDLKAIAKELRIEYGI
jgi:LDH2 family malate/lactate/ureidoglycolate dehydrogenase